MDICVLTAKPRSSELCSRPELELGDAIAPGRFSSTPLWTRRDSQVVHAVRWTRTTFPAGTGRWSWKLQAAVDSLLQRLGAEGQLMRTIERV